MEKQYFYKISTMHRGYFKRIKTYEKPYVEKYEILKETPKTIRLKQSVDYKQVHRKTTIDEEDRGQLTFYTTNENILHEYLKLVYKNTIALLNKEIKECEEKLTHYKNNKQELETI